MQWRRGDSMVGADDRTGGLFPGHPGARLGGGLGHASEALVLVSLQASMLVFPQASMLCSRRDVRVKAVGCLACNVCVGCATVSCRLRDVAEDDPWGCLSIVLVLVPPARHAEPVHPGMIHPYGYRRRGIQQRQPRPRGSERISWLSRLSVPLFPLAHARALRRGAGVSPSTSPPSVCFSVGTKFVALWVLPRLSFVSIWNGGEQGVLVRDLGVSVVRVHMVPPGPVHGVGPGPQARRLIGDWVRSWFVPEDVGRKEPDSVGASALRGCGRSRCSR